MKLLCVRNVFLIVLLALFRISLFSQTTFKTSDILPNDVSWVKVKDIPETELQAAGIISYVFHVNDSNILELFIEKKNKFIKIASYSDQCIFNPAKAEPILYQDGNLTLCSELPYKATSVCCLFDFKKPTPEFVRLMTSDEDADYLYRGDSLLLQGEIEKAVKAYEQIAKPSNYMDVVGKGVEILESAYDIALVAALKKDFKKAVSVMESALRFKSLWVLDANEFDSPAELEKYEKEIWKYNRSIRDLLESYVVDYGYWLYESGKISQSVSYNSYLTVILSDNPKPCLNWANGLYKLNQYELAKQAYKIFLQRAEKWGEEYSIPEYVRERTR